MREPISEHLDHLTPTYFRHKISGELGVLMNEFELGAAGGIYIQLMIYIPGRGFGKMHFIVKGDLRNWKQLTSSKLFRRFYE